MGIETVGIYSEPDRHALHVDAMDLAVSLGGETAAESYLRLEAVIDAAVATGCDAVHPGYGFLAENADAAEAVIAAGMVWVGPTPDQIRLLGDKVLAKKAAVEAGVRTTEIIECAPGSTPPGVTYPALVKAAAGGGGRGMRIVESEDGLSDAIEGASREAEAAFGDGTVFIEPYIENGRHVEVQILGDAHGAVIHLGERDCSVQRRNQKVIEESPSPGISAEVRQALLDGAIALASSVGYQNAGTVEYLVGEGDDAPITFLEVNTRLQVEHPVTEAVTGLDLVELQLRVAAGEELGLTQDDVTFTGHAIEVRVVAEDPAAAWMPSTGTIDFLEFGSNLRIDSGFVAGSGVSVHYDSMLAKLISHGPDRATAVRQMRAGLRRSLVSGVHTNLAMLEATMGESTFVEGAATTSYLSDHPGGPSSDPPLDADALLIGAVAAHEFSARLHDSVTGFAPSGWRNVFTNGERQTWRIDGNDVETELLMCHDYADVLIGPWPTPTDDGSLSDDMRRRASIRFLHRTRGHQVVEIDSVRFVFDTALVGDVVHVRSAVGSASFELQAAFPDTEMAVMGGGPICPLPGTVIAVNVAEGDSVTEGQSLMVIEAMKMEHQITAATDGVVTTVHFATGQRVDQGDLLVTLDSPPSQ